MEGTLTITTDTFVAPTPIQPHKGAFLIRPPPSLSPLGLSIASEVN